MGDMNGRSGYSQPTQGSSSFAPEILNECKDIDRGIDELQNKIAYLDRKQKESLTATESMTSALDALSTEITDYSRNLNARIKMLKTNPKHLEPSNKPQVDRIQRRLDKAFNDLTRLEVAHQKALDFDQDRQLLIAYPESTEEERAEIRRNLGQNGGVFTSRVGFP